MALTQQVPDVLRHSVVRRLAVAVVAALLVVGGVAAFVVTDVSADVRD